MGISDGNWRGFASPVVAYALYTYRLGLPRYTHSSVEAVPKNAYDNSRRISQKIAMGISETTFASTAETMKIETQK